LINSMTLSELITDTIEEYELLAIELAKNTEKFRLIKDKLNENLPISPLYNTSLYTESLESAYTQIHENNKQALKSNHIYIN
jgi:protein O-GlcNAc transferase